MSTETGEDNNNNNANFEESNQNSSTNPPPDFQNENDASQQEVGITENLQSSESMNSNSSMMEPPVSSNNEAISSSSSDNFKASASKEHTCTVFTSPETGKIKSVKCNVCKNVGALTPLEFKKHCESFHHMLTCLKQSTTPAPSSSVKRVAPKIEQVEPDKNKDHQLQSSQQTETETTAETDNVTEIDNSGEVPTNHEDANDQPPEPEEMETEASGSQTIKCKLCPLEFTTQFEHSSHYVTVHLGIRHWCPSCHRSFTLKSALKKHKLSCPGNDTSEQVPSSSSSTRTTTKVRVHKASFRCSTCKRFFNSGDLLRKHQLEDHPNKQEKPNTFRCDWPGCGKTFNFISSLKTHQLRTHA